MLSFLCTWSLILCAHACDWAKRVEISLGFLLVWLGCFFFQSLPDAKAVSNADDVSFDLQSIAQILALVKSTGSCY